MYAFFFSNSRISFKKNFKELKSLLKNVMNVERKNLKYTWIAKRLFTLLKHIFRIQFTLYFGVLNIIAVIEREWEREVYKVRFINIKFIVMCDAKLNVNLWTKKLIDQLTNQWDD